MDVELPWGCTEPLQLSRKLVFLWEVLPGLGQKEERGKSKDSPTHVHRAVHSSETASIHDFGMAGHLSLCSIKRAPHSIPGWSQHLFHCQNIKEQPSALGFHGEILRNAPSRSLGNSASLGLLQPHTCPGHTLPSQAAFLKSGNSFCQSPDFGMEQKEPQIK